MKLPAFDQGQTRL